jgi:hypothetical protein
MKQVQTKKHTSLPEGSFTSFKIKVRDADLVIPIGGSEMTLEWPLSFHWQSEVHFVPVLESWLAGWGIILTGFEIDPTNIHLFLYNPTSREIGASKGAAIVRVMTMEPVQLLPVDLTMHKSGVVDTTPTVSTAQKKAKRPSPKKR